MWPWSLLVSPTAFIWATSQYSQQFVHVSKTASKVSWRRRPEVYLEIISNLGRSWTTRWVDTEVKLLEEHFAKALKRKRLLWCNPGLWSLKEEERKHWQNNYKRRYHIGQGSVFRRLFVKDDLSKPALAFTWWAPHGPKLDDKKEEDCWQPF